MFRFEYRVLWKLNSHEVIFRVFAFYRLHNAKTEALYIAIHEPSRTRLLATYSRRARMEKGLFERWKRARLRGIVPKLLTAGGQPCYRWHVLAIGRPASEREVETGGRRPWDTGHETEAALLNSHPIDTLSSRGMCESIGTKHAKYRRSVTTSMMLKVDTLQHRLTREFYILIVK